MKFTDCLTEKAREVWKRLVEEVSEAESTPTNEEPASEAPEKE